MSFHWSKSHGGVTNFVICLLIVVAIFNDSFDSPSRGFLFIIVSLMSLLFSSALTIQFFSTFFSSLSLLSKALHLRFNYSSFFFFTYGTFDDYTQKKFFSHFCFLFLYLLLFLLFQRPCLTSLITQKIQEDSIKEQSLK
jgi:hypothetical protein